MAVLCIFVYKSRHLVNFILLLFFLCFFLIKLLINFFKINNLAIVWYHNNRALINGDRFRILTNETKSTLIIKSVEREDFGFYICKAMNYAGDATSQGKLIENSEAFMTAEEIEEHNKKTEKKQSKKSKSSKKFKSEIKSESSSVNVEATVRTSKKKSSKKSSESTSVDASASFKRKIVKPPVEAKTIESSSELTITKCEEIFVQETEETFISEVEHKTIHTTINVNELKDIDELKSCKEVNEMLEKLKSQDFGKEKEAVKELVTVGYMLKKGLSTDDVQKLFQSNMFPNLQTAEAQSALVQLVEREGHSNLVSDILSEKADEELDENFIAAAGFRAFLKMIETKTSYVEDFIYTITPQDFTSNNWTNHSSEV
jgi:Immunoglobulin I-set domain